MVVRVLFFVERADLPLVDLDLDEGLPAGDAPGLVGAHREEQVVQNVAEVPVWSNAAKPVSLAGPDARTTAAR